MNTPSPRSLTSLLLLSLIATGCCGGRDSDGGYVPPSEETPEINPGAFLVADSQPAHDALFDELWTALAQEACWDAEDTGLARFRFFGEQRYAYGVDLEPGGEPTPSCASGTIDLGELGTHEGRPAARTRTWTGDVELFVLCDDGSLAHVWSNGTNDHVEQRYRPFANEGGPASN